MGVWDVTGSNGVGKGRGGGGGFKIRNSFSEWFLMSTMSEDESLPS